MRYIALEEDIRQLRAEMNMTRKSASKGFLGVHWDKFFYNLLRATLISLTTLTLKYGFQYPSLFAVLVLLRRIVQKVEKTQILILKKDDWKKRGFSVYRLEKLLKSYDDPDADVIKDAFKRYESNVSFWEASKRVYESWDKSALPLVLQNRIEALLKDPSESRSELERLMKEAKNYV